ncbi:MAG: BON domain-containing protein [Alphaproteobacteria bacterium]|jgi:osmotically-inducible protein OsmY|nr:BON domain-containing protein [Alphaproteobacteria bacterium]
MAKTMQNMKQIHQLCAALVAGTIMLSACAPAGVVLGAGASVGVSASEERGIKGAGSDALIRVAINEAWFKNDFDTFSRLNLQIYEGRVLLSGRVPDQARADKAVQIAWQPKNVREVINEIEISNASVLNNFGNDTLINARLDFQLLLDTKISSINYLTRSVAGTVFLMGVAQNRAELDRVFGIARDIPNVKRVISHVILKDDPRRAAAPAGKPLEKPAAQR